MRGIVGPHSPRTEASDSVSVHSIGMAGSSRPELPAASLGGRHLSFRSNNQGIMHYGVRRTHPPRVLGTGDLQCIFLKMEGRSWKSQRPGPGFCSTSPHRTSSERADMRRFVAPVDTFCACWANWVPRLAIVFVSRLNKGRYTTRRPTNLALLLSFFLQRNSHMLIHATPYIPAREDPTIS